MTPKDKYKELFVKFNDVIPPNFSEDIDDAIALDIKATKKCIIILCDEIINNMMLYYKNFDAGKPIHHKSYWEEVKKIKKV